MVRHFSLLKWRPAEPHCDFVGAVLRVNFAHAVRVTAVASPHTDEIRAGAMLGTVPIRAPSREISMLARVAAWRRSRLQRLQKIKERICGFQFHVIMTDVEYLLHNGTGS